MEVRTESISSFINGDYVASSSTALTYENKNPATNATLNVVHIADDTTLQQAVAGAQHAFDVWSNMTVTERSEVLLKAASLLREHCDELAVLEVLDTGKPISEAKSVDIHSAAEVMEYYAKVALAYEGSVMPDANALIYTTHEPLGVCVGIGAWNYPIQIASWKAAPALIMGNTMVYKPSEHTPMTALKLAEIFMQAGMPAGVFNVVLGDGGVAEQLLANPGIAKVSFTGSVPTGRKVSVAAARQLIPATLELGGKSPLIIFEDADIDEAVTGAMLANFYTQGEVCSNGTRVFVAKNIEEEFTKKLLERVKALKIGDPMDPETQIGALISREHLQKVTNYIEQGVGAGAKLLYGGKLLDSAVGNFIEPTIFTNCAAGMTIVDEEIFGPVMSLMSFTSEDDVIQHANNTPYGLAAGLFTRDIKRAHLVAKRLQAGVCWVNNYNITPPSMPFGGYKHSGLGRENGFKALSQYTQTKSIYVELEKIDSPY